jgi:hypothetical protein
VPIIDEAVRVALAEAVADAARALPPVTIIA